MIRLVPIVLRDANAAVARWHRHHQPVPGAKFCVGVARGDELCGVAIAGRPVARAYDDGMTLEVTRVATDGTRNANSMLYGAIQRAAFALGYRRLITYTRTDESGASLRGVNWKVVAQRPARSWDTCSVKRPRKESTDPHGRLLWEVVA